MQGIKYPSGGVYIFSLHFCDVNIPLCPFLELGASTLNANLRELILIRMGEKREREKKGGGRVLEEGYLETR